MSEDDESSDWGSPQGKAAAVILVIVLLALLWFGWPTVASFMRIFD